MSYVELTQLENGDLKITLNQEYIQEVREMHEKEKFQYQTLFDILESWITDDYYELLSQHDYLAIGALTDAPIIGYMIERDNDDDITDMKHCWWYPNYMVKNCIEELLDKDTDHTTIFTNADD